MCPDGLTVVGAIRVGVTGTGWNVGMRTGIGRVLMLPTDKPGLVAFRAGQLFLVLTGELDHQVLFDELVFGE